MSVKSFKFVSPGVFVNEVDNSQLPRLPEEMGPVIIGRAERGPAMVPVKIDSFSEFVETFGEPIAGGQADDGWRQGNRLGPTYGAFAAQAYLKNGSPITFVRLLGEAHPNKGSGGDAGWSMNGAYGIFVDVDDDTTDPQGDATNGHLAAIVYTTLSSGSAVQAQMTTSGDIKVSIDAVGPETPGSVASQVLVVNATNEDAEFDTTKDKFELYQLAEQNGQRELALTVSFDKNVSTNVIDVVAKTLVVGIGNTISKKELAEAIADGINEAGEAVRLTASVALGEDENFNVTIACDDVGEITSPIIQYNGQPGDNTAADAAGVIPFVIETLKDGANYAAGQASSNAYVVNFDRGSKKYIRNVLNTNPTLTNPRITKNQATHFLGATFDQYLEANVNDIIRSVTAVSLSGYEDYKESATAPQTPWIRSQYMGSQADLGATPLKVDDVEKLFKFHSLYAGEWEQKNLKISIVDVAGPSSDFVKYGTFSVLVRSASDTDASPVVYERYSNVNLDPTSPRYIAAVIGDMKMEWDDLERRYKHIGEYANQSRFIRVEVASDVATGAANPELLPFAFAVPAHQAIDGKKVPKFHLRQNTKDDTKLGSPKDACFGVSTDRPDSPGRHDESYQDIVRLLFAKENMFNGSELFSLDLIAKEGTKGNDAKFTPESLRQGTSFNATPGTDVNGDAIEASYNRVLLEGFNKFTVPLTGGLDGLNIKEIEPFCDDVTSLGGPIGNYAYNSIAKAIDIVADPEVVECNLMAIPGVATPGLTGKLISTCEARADALAVIDLENDYKPRGWDTSDESLRLPQVEQAVGSLKARGLSSSYGCAFFPWVQVSDDINNRKVWMPPSVVALGTMASSAAKSELWFAPAGFTRGGLSAGAGGLPVSQVRMRLNSKERDALYEANINPIAQFPAEGIVVFGQKTLQVTPSALDRINVRRLMIHVKKEISRMAATTLFDQNVQATWNRFLGKADPFLSSVQTRFGLTEYKIVLDETTTTAELIDRNIMYAKVFLKPARAIEFIAIDFTITNSGASFED